MTSALESKDADTTEKNYEASNKSLQDGICSKPGGNGIDPDHSTGRESSVEHTEKPFFHHEFSSWSSNPYSINIRPCQLNAFHGPFHPFVVNHKFQYAPIKMAPLYFSPCYQFQEFQYFVVIDFEATCDKERKPYPQEIIEFPSVIVSGLTGQLEACFQTYVRPTCNQLLTDFCKDLTGIQQIQVDRGVTLSEALLSHDKWLESKGIKNSNFAVVTWSDWDCRVMLESECRFKNIKKPSYFDRWINLRVPFSEVFVGERCNLKEAVEKAGLSWQGRPHCGLDDAKNTARLLQLLMHKGFKFSITNSLAGPTSDCEFTPVPKTAHVSPPQPLKPRELHFPLVQCVPCCYCGVGRSKGMVRKPGPKQGSVFFGCGNWTYERGARCQYFEWASSS